ncbi:MAG: hypothetical protein ACK47B_02290 [Armatimonadota bacterium]
MSRFAALALAALSLFSAAGALAAPKADGSTCEAGVGKQVCCKAGTAHGCDLGTSCCEVGNKGFFKASTCSASQAHRAAAAKACAAPAAEKEAGSQAAHAGHTAAKLGTSCCEVGNKSFFKSAGCCASKGAKTASACCAK